MKKSLIEVLISCLFAHYRLEVSRTLQDLSYISMASKNSFWETYFRFLIFSFLMKVQLLKGGLNGRNVLFKNLIGTLRNCALFFLGLSLVEVRVTGPVDGLLVGDVKTFRTKYKPRFQDLFSEWLHQIE